MMYPRIETRQLGQSCWGGSAPSWNEILMGLVFLSQQAELVVLWSLGFLMAPPLFYCPPLAREGIGLGNTQPFLTGVKIGNVDRETFRHGAMMVLGGLIEQERW